MLTSGNLYTQYIQKLTVLLKKIHKSKSHVNMKVHLSFCSKKKAPDYSPSFNKSFEAEAYPRIKK